MSALARLRAVDVDQVVDGLRTIARYATAAARIVEYARAELTDQPPARPVRGTSHSDNRSSVWTRDGSLTHS